MVLAIDVLPARARRFLAAYVPELAAELTDDLVSLVTYGSAVLGRWPANDVDIHAFVERRFDDARRARINELLERLTARFEVDHDGWFVTIDEARGTGPPCSQLRLEARDDCWALHRAHFHAGKFVGLHGADPRDIVAVPTQDELRRDLAAVLRDAATSVGRYGGYAVLNVCRVWCSLELDDVVLSKRDAALWGLATLPGEWHPLLLAAVRSYGTKQAGDDELLADRAPGFIERHAPSLERRLVDEHDNLNGEASEGVGPIERSGGPRGG